MKTYHFDLTGLDPDRTYTFHKRGRVYPIERHSSCLLYTSDAADE